MSGFCSGFAIGMGAVSAVINLLVLKNPQAAFVWVGVGIIFALVAIATKK